MTRTPDDIKKGLEWDEVDESLRKIRFDDAGEVVEWKPKTSTDTKNGLLCCTIEGGCNDCPYQQDCFQTDGFSELAGDALALIQQLQAENSRYHQETTEMYAEMCMLREKVHILEAERDAMKEALGLMVYQYCVSGTELDHRYMCAGETAFRVLGLEQYGDTRTLESWLFPECQEPEA